jgi:hypothetical protein
MRPRRLYFDQDKDKYYYIVNSKKKYIRKPKTMSQKQLVKINIKNIIGETRPRRVKRRKYKKQIKLQKKIVPELSKAIVNEGGLPVYLFRENKKFGTLDDFVKSKDKDDVKLLTDQFKVPTLVNKAKPPIIEDVTTVPPSLATSTWDLKGSALKEFPQLEKPSVVTPVPKKKPADIPFTPADDTGTVIYDEEGEYPEIDPELEDALNILKISGTPYKTPNQRTKANKLLRQKNTDLFIPKRIDSKDEMKWRDTIVNIAQSIGQGESKGDMEGSGDSNDGLYNDEIQKILKANIKDFVPVIAKDEVQNMMAYIKPGMKRFGFIINTSDSSSDGSGNDGEPVGHWRAVYINNEDDFPSVEIFDPLVNEPENTLIEGLRKISKKMNPEKMFKVKINYLQRQNKNTGTCGHHSIKFLEDRYNGIGFSLASGYDDYIEKHKPDHSVDGEKDLKQKIKKYNSFI